MPFSSCSEQFQVNVHLERSRVRIESQEAIESPTCEVVIWLLPFDVQCRCDHMTCFFVDDFAIRKQNVSVKSVGHREVDEILLFI
jgi:hypothetical protein